jgi:hypothetical protein
VFTGFQPQNPTLTITTQADSQIDTWMQNIFLPGANSPATTPPAFNFSAPPSLDIQESSSEQGIGELEFNSMDMSWALSPEVTDQFLDLLASPISTSLNSITFSGEPALTADPIVV